MSESMIFADEKPRVSRVSGVGLGYTEILTGEARIREEAEKRFRTSPEMLAGPKVYVPFFWGPLSRHAVRAQFQKCLSES